MADLKWAVLGPAGIARKFAAGIAHVPGASLYAVASRDIERARAFAAASGAPVAYGSYEELAEDPNVDAVYISTPHVFHCEQALLCIEHGKHVLCEKPLSYNAETERRMVLSARDHGVFLMEAMWSRYLPVNLKLCELLASGRIGEVRALSADFSFSVPRDSQPRLFQPELAGGALLDVGIYVMAYASMVFGPHPEKVQSFAFIGPTGVDEHTSMQLQYAGGKIASLTCGVHAFGPQSATVVGTEGRITSPSFWEGTRLIVTDRTGKSEELTVPIESEGFAYEIAEATQCIRQGRLESPLMTLDESVSIMENMDAMRRSWGFEYPMEKGK